MWKHLRTCVRHATPLIIMFNYRVNARFYVECRTGDRGVLGSNPGVTCRSRLHNSEIKPRMGCLVYSYIIPNTIIYGGREAERGVGRERRGGREGGREGGRVGGWERWEEGGRECMSEGYREEGPCIWDFCISNEQI